MEQFDDEMILEINDRIDEVLEQNRFNNSDYGTQLFKELIYKVVCKLSAISEEEELEKLRFDVVENMYSPIYFDVARNDNDMGVKTFHDCVKLAYLKAGKATGAIIKNPNNYMQLVFDLAREVLEDKPKVRVLTRNRFGH